MGRVAVYVCLLASACCLSSLSAMEGIEVDRDFEINNNLIGNEFQVENGLSGVGADITNEVMGLLPERDVQNVIGISQEHMDYRNNEESFKFVTHNVKYIRRLIDAVEEIYEFPPDEIEFNEIGIELYDLLLNYRGENELRFYESIRPYRPLGLESRPYCPCPPKFGEDCKKYKRLFLTIFECVEHIISEEKEGSNAEALDKIRNELRASVIYLAATNIEEENKRFACRALDHSYSHTNLLSKTIIKGKEGEEKLVRKDGKAFTEEEIQLLARHLPPGLREYLPEGASKYFKLQENERALTEEEKQWFTKYVSPSDIPESVPKNFEVPKDRGEVTDEEKIWLTDYMWSSQEHPSEPKSFEKLMEYRECYACLLMRKTLSDLKKWLGLEPLRLKNAINHYRLKSIVWNYA